MSHDDDDWVTDAEMEALRLEKTVRGEETDPELAERLLAEASPRAAMAIIHLATSPTASDRVKLTAAQFIINRACGTEGSSGGKADPWKELFADITKELKSS